MRAPDFSSNKCYPLEMVNAGSTDLRLRLDCRTGESINISNSRIFVFGGCTLPIDIDSGFKVETLYEKIDAAIKKLNPDKTPEELDYNHYLSAECFRLSLINRKWYHYLRKEPSNAPSERMFHSMVIYDNYIYVMGGLRFNKDNKFEILNDVWKFDTIDQRWNCYYPNGNALIMPRFDHTSFILETAEIFDKSMIHSGLCLAGGINLQNSYVPRVQVLDVLDEKLPLFNFEDLTEFRYLNEEIVCKNKKINLRGTTTGVHAGSCPVSSDTRLCIFENTPDVNNFEPFILFNESTEGIRLPHVNNFDLNKLNNISFPVFGNFGENAIVSGYSKTEKKMGTFLYNIKTASWTKLHISCMHKIYSHKLTKGFVWESHHKVAYLGSMSMVETCGSVDYFANLVVVSLPFTNFYSKQPLVTTKQSRMHISRSSGSSIMSGKNDGSDVLSALSAPEIHRKCSDFTTSELLDASKTKSTLTQSQTSTHETPLTIVPPYSYTHNFVHSAQHQNDHTGGFAGYAYHVAQQLQVNSIRSVLPPYAIAIGKTAFERYNSFSDFDLVCSDGTVISVPLALCRRRWGDGFDELFSEAYAKAFVEDKAKEILSSRGSTYDSGDSGENVSLTSRNGLNTPYFRYPFQEKDSGSTSSSHPHATFSNFHMNRMDTSPNRGLVKSAAANSRHHSISGNLYASSSINRASISLSLSRRNSLNPQSRHHSFSNHDSRRGSIHTLLSRRNSLNIAGGQASRRGSALSKSSFLSSSTGSSNSLLGKSAPSLKSTMIHHHSRALSPTGSSSMLPLSPSSTGSRANNSTLEASSFGDVNFEKQSNNRKDHIKKEYIAPNEIERDYLEYDELDLTDIPAPTPMPTFLPNGESIKSNNDSNGDIGGGSAGITYESLRTTTDEELAELIYSEASAAEMNSNKFNPLRLPRCMYLPYPNETVSAIVEYLYSGQIGANWKLFPTGIQILVASKQLGIPLLYDLVLELFFVALGIIESSCKSKLILYLEMNREGESCDDVYNLLDVKGNCDSDADLNLLLEAIGNIRRDSGATITHDLMVDEGGDCEGEGETGGNCDQINQDEEYEKIRKGSQINGIDPLYIGPTDHIQLGVHEDENADDLKNSREDGNHSELRKLSNVERVKITAATLDARGFEIFEDVEDELTSKLKEFSMDSGGSVNVEGGGKCKGETEKKPKKKKKSKLREWPLMKDLLIDELPEDTNEVIIDLFIETGALINDSKLLLQSLHVQELQHKVKLIRHEAHSDLTSGEGLIGFAECETCTEIVRNQIKGKGKGKGRCGHEGNNDAPSGTSGTSDTSDTSSTSSAGSSSSSSINVNININISDAGHRSKGDKMRNSGKDEGVTGLKSKKSAAPILPSTSKAHPMGISYSGLSPEASSTGPAIGDFNVSVTAPTPVAPAMSDSGAMSSLLAAAKGESPGLGPVLSPSSSIASLTSVNTAATGSTGKSGKAGKSGQKHKKSRKGFFTRFRKQ